jgi:hypothetical protein
MQTDRTNLDGNNGSGLNGSLGRDEAEWSAFRYVLGEMSADEADAFERTLESDIQACERVAAAAGLATNLYAALATELKTEMAVGSRMVVVAPSAVPARSKRGGLWAVVGLVAAVCVLAAGALTLLPVIGDHQEGATSDRADTGSLVAIWTERSTESAPESAAGAAAGDLGGMAGLAPDEALTLVDPDDAAVDSETDAMLLADEDYNVPGWMIAAVGGKWNADGSPAEIREN